MKIAKSQLNKSAIALEDAQTEIRIVVKQGFLRNESRISIERKVLKVINEAVKKIALPRLASDSKQSLLQFANRQYALWQSLGISVSTFLYLATQNAKNFPYKLSPTTRTDTTILHDIARMSTSTISPSVGPPPSAPLRIMTPEEFRTYETDAKGVPLSTYYKDVWNKKVKPTLDRLMGEVALDTHDYTGRNSLRNLAEMEVRYNDHLETIERFKTDGVKLVVASAHADCSDRCAKWQGRVYSLDGSYGTTAEGYRYVPLEKATDVFYTTKAGRTYKNGLLGFNCRHKLEEYTGKLLPTVSKETRKREYEITIKQRELERAVRKKKVEALMLKDIDKEGYLRAKAEATRLYETYKSYCHENKRAYYPMRVAI